MTRVNTRPRSASADAARERDLARLARLSVLERIAKALELGRRGREMAEQAPPKGKDDAHRVGLFSGPPRRADVVDAAVVTLAIERQLVTVLLLPGPRGRTRVSRVRSLHQSLRTAAVAVRSFLELRGRAFGDLLAAAL